MNCQVHKERGAHSRLIMKSCGIYICTPHVPCEGLSDTQGCHGVHSSLLMKSCGIIILHLLLLLECRPHVPCEGPSGTQGSHGVHSSLIMKS